MTFRAFTIDLNLTGILLPKVILDLIRLIRLIISLKIIRFSIAVLISFYCSSLPVAAEIKNKVIASNVNDCANCQKDEPNRLPEKSKILTREYKNDYFNMSIQLPAEWHLFTKGKTIPLIDLAIDYLAGESEAFKQQMKLTQATTLNLINIYKYPFRSVFPNTQFASTAEPFDIQSESPGKEFIKSLKQNMLISKINFTFPKSMHEERIGGVIFDVQDVQFDISGIVTYQQYYVTIIKGYALGFVLSWPTDNEHQSLIKILSSIEFNS